MTLNELLKIVGSNVRIQVRIEMHGFLFKAKEYTFAYDVKPTNMLLSNPTLLVLLDGKETVRATGSPIIELNKTTRITYVFKNTLAELRYLEIRISGMSGIYSNFQIEEGEVATEYSAAHEVSYPIPQAMQQI